MQETQVRPLGQEDFPEVGSGIALQSSCLENPVNRGAWWAKSGVTKRHNNNKSGWTMFPEPRLSVASFEHGTETTQTA